MHNPYSDNIDKETAARRYTGKGLAEFHMFNDNGVLAAWRALSDELIAHGRGYLAYGDIGYLYSELSKLSYYSRQRVSKSELQSLVCCIERTIERGWAFLESERASNGTSGN